MIKFETSEMVLEFVEVFGYDALETAISKGKLKPEEAQLIRWVKESTYSDIIRVVEVGDGNYSYSIEAEFESCVLGGIHTTDLTQIKIVCYGRNAGIYSVNDAMNNNIITRDQLSSILRVIAKRNKAKDAFEN